MEPANINHNLPLVVIVGPTASGKTSLALRLAKQYGGEIISADSRAVYRGLDIGTAKPTAEEQRQVPHWGIDLVNPGERFSAADFKQYAVEKIADIRTRGGVPFLVGGTGLYIDSITHDFQFPEVEFSADRTMQLEKYSIEQLQNYCIENNISLPENSKNKRYLINAISRGCISPQRSKTPIRNSIIVGIATEKDELLTRIAQRSEQMFVAGVVREATTLLNTYGSNHEAMTGNIYQVLEQYINGGMTLEQAKTRLCTLDWRLAKRQMTWFKRNEHIRWMNLEDAYTYCVQLLASVNKS